jgi:DNA-binding HxlR family transcriptional regulator
MPISSTEFDELQKPVEERILRLYESKGKHVLTTTEIRNEIEMSHQTLLKKLSRLSTDGKIKRMTFPGSRVIFWELQSV